MQIKAANALVDMHQGHPTAGCMCAWLIFVLGLARCFPVVIRSVILLQTGK